MKNEKLREAGVREAQVLLKVESIEISNAESAVQAAEQVSRGNRGDRPSVITVEILGYGEERLVPDQDRSAGATDYRPDGAVRVLGAGALDERQSAELTEAERRSML